MTLEAILNIIQALLWIVWIFWFLFSYKSKIDKALNWYDSIEKINSRMWCIEKYIEDLSSFFHNTDTKQNIVPTQLKDFWRYYQANSPLRLTERWINLIEESWFKKIMNDKNDFIIENVKQKLDDKKESEAFFYFAEQYSVSEIQKFYDQEDNILDPVREYMFSTGKTEEKDIIIRALWLYLRDIVIEAYWKTKEFIELCEREKKQEQSNKNKD